MPKKLEIIGKSREEIERLLARKERHELLDLIANLANLEPMFSPERIAAARELAPATVLGLMKTGVIRAHLVSHNRYRAPLSAVRAWDAQTALELERQAA